MLFNYLENNNYHVLAMNINVYPYRYGNKSINFYRRPRLFDRA